MRTGELQFARRVRDDLAPGRVCAEASRVHGQYVGWFGVVHHIDAASMAGGEGMDGWAEVSLDYRTHRDPHQCWGSNEASCRVTVSDQTGPSFRARLQLAADEWSGANAVRPGSLLKVYGTIAIDRCSTTDGPELDIDFHRHWPNGQYATVWPGASGRE
jgi:hypothetical protein